MKKLQVAVFEDDPSTALLLKRNLECWLLSIGCEPTVEVYSDITRENLEKIHTHNWPELVVTDHYLPSGISRDVCDHLINKGFNLRLSNPTFICFSAEPSIPSSRLFAFIVQKFNWSELQSKISLCADWLAT